MFEPACSALISQGDGESVGGQIYSPALLTEDMGSYSQLLGLSPAELKEEKKKEVTVNVDAFYGVL